MFAGIIEGIGKVAGLSPLARGPHASSDAARLRVEMGHLRDDLRPGASVAVNGACLTLDEPQAAIGAFDIVPETWRQTTLQYLSVGDEVNLERSLRVGGRIDGHFVQGHVDGIGIVERIERERGEYQLWIAVDAALMPYIVRKGSIAVDGTSLTVVDVGEGRFSVALIPTTLERTVLGRRKPGHKVNIETDILARIVVARLEQQTGAAGPATGGVTWEHLRGSGFLS